MEELQQQEPSEEIKALMRKQQNEFITIIEAFSGLEKSQEWNTVKELVFERSLKGIERQILNESLNPKINTDKLYRLQGEWAWAKQYNDTGRFIDTLRKQLQDIKQKLK